MIKYLPNIEIGKKYSASYLLNEIKNYPSRLQIGHAIIKVNGVDKHLYHTDLNEEQLKNMNNKELKVLSIIDPCEQNFAHKLIMSPETQENLKKIESQKTLCYAVDMNDLIQAGYRFKGIHYAISCMNYVFKRNKMSFTASLHSEGKIDRKYFVKISYRLIDNENENKKCEVNEEQGVI